MSSLESPPTVTVAICLHNSSAYVEETLESVFAQTYGDYEVVLVDDGSTDGCASLVQSRFRDPRLRVVRSSHRGLGHARGLTVAHARGRLVAFLDHDDVWRPDKLERQVAEAEGRPEVALIFSDCALIDARGRALGTLSARYDYARLDLAGVNGFRELLSRGCFVDVSTALARTAALRAVGGFDARYVYVEDYDMWLRLARRWPIAYIGDPLAKRRIHDRQFTRTHPEVALAEQRELLRRYLGSPSYPASVRTAVGDYLLGQHRDCARRLVEQGRPWAAALAVTGMARFPGRLADFTRDRLARSGVGRLSEAVIGGGGFAVRWTWEVLRRLVRGPRPSGPAAVTTMEIWIDGTALGETPTGYFNLVAELTRAVLAWTTDECAVHVVTPASGLEPLRERLGPDASRLRTHVVRLGSLSWATLYSFCANAGTVLLAVIAATALLFFGVAGSHAAASLAGAALLLAAAVLVLDERVAWLRSALGPARLPLAARALRFLRLRAVPPWRPFHGPETIEVLVWRGRFRHAGSRKIALVQDLTTKVHPELHTPGNVSEFDDYLTYALRYADDVVTVSERSRRDILERLDVYGERVHVLAPPVNPIYRGGPVTRGVTAAHGLDRPYVLCVATAEPRKNLRRLVRAFERLDSDDAGRAPLLALAGAEGWDEGFRRSLVESDAYRRIRWLGYVPLADLPSLYRLASVVVHPSVYEGFGLPVLEAMCSAAVVVTSRIGVLPAALADGLIDFDPYSTEDLGRALRRALALGPAEASSYREACRSRAEAFLEGAAARPPLPGLSRAAGIGEPCASRS